MNALRNHITAHRWPAVWLVMAALCLKLLVPAGFMPAMTNGTMTVIVCSGTMRQAVTVAIPGKAGSSEKAHEKADMPCAFGALAAPMLGGVDPVLLAIAIAFVMATGFAALVRQAEAGHYRLRPPLRGPPATA